MAVTPNAMTATVAMPSILKLRGMLFYLWFKGRDYTVKVLYILTVCLGNALQAAHLAVCVMNIYPTVHVKAGKIVREVLTSTTSTVGKDSSKWGEYIHKFHLLGAVAQRLAVPAEGPRAMSMGQVGTVVR